MLVLQTKIFFEITELGSSIVLFKIMAFRTAEKGEVISVLKLIVATQQFMHPTMIKMFCKKERVRKEQRSWLHCCRHHKALWQCENDPQARRAYD